MPDDHSRIITARAKLEIFVWLAFSFLEMGMSGMRIKKSKIVVVVVLKEINRGSFVL